MFSSTATIKPDDDAPAFLPDNSVIAMVLNDQDILAVHILPFVGVGQYAFIAGVSCNMRDSYRQYVTQLDHPPYVRARYNFKNMYPVWKHRSVAITDTFYSAAFANMSCAKFWYISITKENDPEYTQYVCPEAAKSGSLPVLQWLRDKEFPWDEDTCAYAAQCGHFDVLKWAHENGCSWDAETCSAAAREGHLEVVKYAHENGCPCPGHIQIGRR